MLLAVKEGLMPPTANHRFALMLHVSSSLSQLIPAAGALIRIRQGLALTAVKRHLSNTVATLFITCDVQQNPRGRFVFTAKDKHRNVG